MAADSRFCVTNTESERLPLFDAMNHQPVMTIFAGPNGGGKNTLRDEWSLSHPLGTIIDVDFIARQHQKRVEQRVANGGHAIPAADIERRYFRSLTNLLKAIDLADHMHVFTNVSRYVLVCTIEQGRMVYKDRQSPKWLADVIRQME